MSEYKKSKLRIGILSHEFLINIGANDFLKNIIRGLAVETQNDIVFLCPRSNEHIEQMASPVIKEQLKKIPYLKQVLRAVMRHTGLITDMIIRKKPGVYDYYFEACPRMELLECELDAATLARIQIEKQIDIFLPSIHILPTTLPYVTYWPDCQPKHYPEFFNDEAQRVRDERIRGLFATGKPMIINSRDAKKDMIGFYGAKSNKIFDLPFAPIIEFEKLTPKPELSAPYRLQRKYFIICNQFWVHKSIETVIQAAAISKKRGLDVDFVFTGRMQEPRKPGYIDSLRQLVIELDVSDVVRFLDYIPKDDQLELMKASVAVIQPTLFEGGPGGGSIYDAISLGVRAIASDIPINYELPLDSARVALFKKKDPAALVEKMEIFLNTPYDPSSTEDLYQQSQRYTAKLSARLYEAIDYAMSLPGRAGQ